MCCLQPLYQFRNREACRAIRPFTRRLATSVAPLLADDCFGAFSRMFPFVPAYRTALLNAVTACPLFFMITTLFLPHSAPSHTIPEVFQCPCRWLDHPGSQSTICLTPSSAQLTFHSHTAVSASCSECLPLLPAAKIQAGTLVARSTSLCQTNLAIAAYAGRTSAVRAEAAQLHFWHVTIFGNMTCVALRSSRSASDGFPFGIRALIFVWAIHFCLDQLYVNVQQLDGT